MKKETWLFDFNVQRDNFALERALHLRGFTVVAGCDEAGRGPLAGPVVAACVVLPQKCEHNLFLDSKILSHRRRQELAGYLSDINASFAIGSVSPLEIDQINIHQASLLAMKRAVCNLRGSRPDFILVDGKFPVPLAIHQLPLTKGESKSGSIAAASIVAKVERDRLMDSYHGRFPAYNFCKNKGYPTREHRLAIKSHGISPIHRRSFKGVREYVS
ncbi:MAG: ribonuclease HII [Desulforhopalus sp.]